MKRKMRNTLPLFLMIAILSGIATLIGGCILFDRCEKSMRQIWYLGEFEAEMKTSKPILKIGDTIHFSLKIPQNFKDLWNNDVMIDRGVQVFVKITTTDNLSDTTITDPSDTSNFFAIDTTIFHVFDKYFETINIKGGSSNPYKFNCELINDFWEIETEYIALKTGNFWASIEMSKILSSKTDLAEGVCMYGDTESFGATMVWKENENNRIDVLFNDAKENYPSYYGFIVEE
jgi:hypothetical protein